MSSRDVREVRIGSRQLRLVNQPYFYEKRCPKHRPPWVRTAEADGIEFCLVNDLASLVWVANLADLELHVPLARAKSFHRPDMVVFDLDPGAPAVKRRGEQGAPLVSSYGTAAPVPRRRTAKIRLTMARINKMWTHAPICAPDTRPSTQSTSRMTVMVQSISRLLFQQR